MEQIVESDDDEADGADSWQPARRDEHLRKDGAGNIACFKSIHIVHACEASNSFTFLCYSFVITPPVPQLHSSLQIS